MFHSLADLESQWQAQVTTMRQAIAELQLPPLQDKPYGADLQLGDDDLSADSVSDDIWEVSSGVDDSPPSDIDHPGIDGFASNEPSEGIYDQRWLRSKCEKFVQFRPGVNAGDIFQQINAVLASDTSENELQM